jgi:hypothetical protein
MHAATAKYEPTTTVVTSSSAAEAEDEDEEEEEAPLVSSSSLVQSFFGFPKARIDNNGGFRRGKGVLEGEAKAPKAKHMGRVGGKDGRTGDQSAEKAAKAAKQSRGGRGDDKHEEERRRQEDEEDALCNKVEALGAEITSFKRENKRLEKLAKVKGFEISLSLSLSLFSNPKRSLLKSKSISSDAQDVARQKYFSHLSFSYLLFSNPTCHR